MFRVDDASQPAATLTASSNAAWTKLSNPTPGTPGYAVYNYCNTPLVGSQCVYDMFVMSPPDRPDMVVVGGLMHYEELKPYVNQARGRRHALQRPRGAHVDGRRRDVDGRDRRRRRRVDAPGPARARVRAGRPGSVLRRLRRRRHPHERRVGGRVRASATTAASPAFNPRVSPTAGVAQADPDRADGHNAGLGTLQMTSISVSPFSPDNTAMTGTQDNGTLSFTGKPNWILPLTGDGGDSGFDAVDPHFRFHTYTGGQMDVNYNDADPTSWLWIGDRFIVNFPEAQRFYAPVVSDPVRRRRSSSARRASGGRRPAAATVPSSRRTATWPHRRVPERPALHGPVWYAGELAEARHVDADEQRRDVAVRDDEGRQHARRSRARRTEARSGPAAAPAASWSRRTSTPPIRRASRSRGSTRPRSRAARSRRSSPTRRTRTMRS